MGAVKVWMGESYRSDKTDEKSTRATVMFGVASTGALFEALKADRVKMVQDAPQFMGQSYWLQFFDPAGNVVEVLGGE